MSTLTRSLLALLLAPAILGATRPASVQAAPAHQPPALRATLQGRTVQVTGWNFGPGAPVTIAVINTHNWRTLVTRSVRAEAATYQCRKGTSIMCGQRDPNAGDVSVETTLHQRLNRGILAVLYRSSGEIGLSRVQAH